MKNTRRVRCTLAALGLAAALTTTTHAHAATPIALAPQIEAYGREYEEPYWAKDGLVITLGGLLKQKSPHKWDRLGTLPPEARPTQSVVFDANSHHGRVRITIRADGDILAYPTPGQISHGWISLSGITYPATPGTQINLRSGVTPYGGRFKEPRWYRQDGAVFLQGMLIDKTKRWGHVATLPKGARPTQRLIFNANSHGEDVRVDVLEDGQITVSAATGPVAKWVSLGGISFPLKAGRALPLARGSKPLGAAYGGVSYSTYGDRVMLSGALVSAGKKFGTVATLPPSLRPTERLIFHGNSHAEAMRIDVHPDGRVIVNAATGPKAQTWISLSNVVFDKSGTRAVAQTFRNVDIRNGGGLCLDLAGPHHEAKKQGGKVQGWSCNGQDNQRWSLVGGRIESTNGLCLDVVRPAMTEPGAKVQVWSCHDKANQQWRLDAEGRLVNGGGLCLDIVRGAMKDNGARVQVWSCNDLPNQKWAMVEAKPSAPKPSTKVTHHIPPPKDGAMVEVRTTVPGTNGKWLRVRYANDLYWMEDVPITPSSVYAIKGGPSVELPSHLTVDASDSSRWDGGVIPYEIAANHPFTKTIESGIGHINALTNLNIRPKKSSDDYWVSIIHDNSGAMPACSSFVGRLAITHQPQRLNLALGCNRVGTVVHELLHAAGFHHEQNRSDRDEHLQIVLANIDPNHHHNFDNAFGYDVTPYDVGSVMHYGWMDFAKDPVNIYVTIDIPKVGRVQFANMTEYYVATRRAAILSHYGVSHNLKMGTAKRLSAMDIVGINRVYPKPTTHAELRPEIVVYQHTGYGGRSVRLVDSVPNLKSRAGWINDAASSIEVISGQWSMYTNFSFKGTRYDVTPLGGSKENGRYGDPGHWGGSHDKVSSVHLRSADKSDFAYDGDPIALRFKTCGDCFLQLATDTDPPTFVVGPIRGGDVDSASFIARREKFPVGNGVALESVAVPGVFIYQGVYGDIVPWNEASADADFGRRVTFTARVAQPGSGPKIISLYGAKGFVTAGAQKDFPTRVQADGQWQPGPTFPAHAVSSVEDGVVPNSGWGPHAFEVVPAEAVTR
ncbi:MAG: M12 family metallopeptidase [Deltaproteobacteria bacterium]